NVELMKANMATYEDLVKCGYLEMKLPRKQRKMAHKVGVICQGEAVWRMAEGLYEVSVIRTEDSERIGLTGDYLITVRKEYLCLHSTKTGTNVMEWELEHLPRFRLQRLSQLQDIDKVLVIMAGKGCKSGEGEFHFLSRQGREILESIKCQNTKTVFSTTYKLTPRNCAHAPTVHRLRSPHTFVRQRNWRQLDKRVMLRHGV
ncbi:hypothetical protein QZH41_012200, partial [Actinostola sp. cb2023]